MRQDSLAAFVEATPKIYDLGGQLHSDLAYSTFTSLLAKLNSVGLLPEAVRREAGDRIEDLTLTWVDASVFQDAGLRSLFTAQEFSDLTAKFKIEWIDDLKQTVRRWESEYITTDEIDHFATLRENLQRAAGFFGGTPQMDNAFANAYRLIDERITELEGEKPPPSSSTFTPPKGSEPLALASIFDDLDEG